MRCDHGVYVVLGALFEGCAGCLYVRARQVGVGVSAKMTALARSCSWVESEGNLLFHWHTTRLSVVLLLIPARGLTLVPGMRSTRIDTLTGRVPIRGYGYY